MQVTHEQEAVRHIRRAMGELYGALAAASKSEQIDSLCPQLASIRETLAGLEMAMNREHHIG